MRYLPIAVLAAALCATPALGVIHVELRSPDRLLCLGEVTTIEIWARGDTNGLWTLAGSIVSSGCPMLVSNPGSFHWIAPFTTASVYSFMGVPTGGILGTPGANGGWNDVASTQNVFPHSEAFAKDTMVKVATYTVTCVDTGETTLSFVPGVVNGILCGGGTTPVDKQIGTLTSLRIVEIPEPLALSLLALGACAIARRRRCC